MAARHHQTPLKTIEPQYTPLVCQLVCDVVHVLVVNQISELVHEQVFDHASFLVGYLKMNNGCSVLSFEIRTQL